MRIEISIDTTSGETRVNFVVANLDDVQKFFKNAFEPALKELGMAGKLIVEQEKKEEKKDEKVGGL